ncbi:carboxypeptidase regulatory-like domain-containing protein [bacterium]|nr:carboxypeptidase regulatory-like domain-containing protein [bacterium]
MRGLITLFAILTLINAAFGVVSIEINGSSETTVTPPAELDFQIGLPLAGDAIELRVYFDENFNRVIEPSELGSISRLIDGFPSIGWVDENDYIVGDDDSVSNGIIYHSKELTFDEDPMGLIDTFTIYYVAMHDGEGTADTAILHIVVPDTPPEPETPYVYGIVRASSDSMPIAGAFCVAIIGDEDESNVSISDSLGRYYIALSDTGDLTLLVIPLDNLHIGYVAASAIHSSDDSLRMNAYCNLGTSMIFGNISSTLPGILPPLLMVTAFNSTSYSISAALVDPISGDYVIPSLEGSVVVELSEDMGTGTDAYIDPSMHEIEVPSSGDVTDVDFVIRGVDSGIEGIVADSSDGTREIPLELIPVYAFSESLSIEFSSVTESDGHFVIPVKGGYEYEVNLLSYNAIPTPYGYESIYVGESDTVTDANFYLNTLTTMPRVEGTVIDASGNPVENADVIAYNEDLAYQLSWQLVASDIDGNYSFENLPPRTGEWKIGAYKDECGIQSPRLHHIEDFDEDSTITGIDFEFGGTGIHEMEAYQVGLFEIIEIQPNPFNSTAQMEFVCSKTLDYVDISIFNILGNKIKTVYQGSVERGTKTFRLIMQDYPSGVYYIKASSGDLSSRKRLILKK